MSWLPEAGFLAWGCRLGFPTIQCAHSKKENISPAANPRQWQHDGLSGALGGYHVATQTPFKEKAAEQCR